MPLSGDDLESFRFFGTRRLLCFFGLARIYTVGDHSECLVALLPRLGKRYLGVCAKCRQLLRTPKTIFKPPKFPPVGETKRKSPPPSKNFCGFSARFIALILVSESGVILSGIGFPPFLGVSQIGTRPDTPIYTPKAIGS